MSLAQVSTFSVREARAHPVYLQIFAPVDLIVSDSGLTFGLCDSRSVQCSMVSKRLSNVTFRCAPKSDSIAHCARRFATRRMRCGRLL